MTEPFYAPRFEILLSGITMAADLAEQVVSLTVESDLDLAGSFDLVLRNPDNVLLDSPLLDIGKNVEVHLGYGADLVPAFLGEVAGVEPSFPADGSPTIHVTGYDKSYKLRRNRPTPTTYQPPTSDSEIAGRIALENGLIPVIDPTPVLTEPVTQKESDFALLIARAERYHFDVYVEWDRLHFQFPRPAFAAHVLEWGRNLSSFTGRISGAGLAGLQVIRGYNQELAQEVYAAAIAVELNPDNLLERVGSSISGLLTSLVRSEFRDHKVENPVDAYQVAASVLADLLEGLYEGQGSCVGLPSLRAGGYVEIRGVGRRFSGTFRARKVTHRLDSSGLRTDFVVSQAGQSSLVGMLRELVDMPSPRKEQKFHGILVGEVVDNHELGARLPQSPLGRVQVRFPDLSDNVVTKWAPCAQPAAGSGTGFYALPDKGDQVLVGFRNGDFNDPYVLGSVWNAKARPPEKNQDGANNRKVIRTRTGHTIAFDDGDEQKSLTVADSAGSEILMDSTNGGVTLSAKGDLTIAAEGNVTISSKKGSVTLKAVDGTTRVTMTKDGVDVT